MEIVVAELQLADEKSRGSREVLTVTSAASNVLASVCRQKLLAVCAERVCDGSTCHLSFPELTTLRASPCLPSPSLPISGTSRRGAGIFLSQLESEEQRQLPLSAGREPFHCVHGGKWEKSLSQGSHKSAQCNVSFVFSAPLQ